MIASIETAAQKGTVKVGQIHDFTTDEVEIRLQLPRGVDAEETIPQLYAYTQCEVSVSSNLNVIRDGHPREMSVTEILEGATKDLKAQLKAELELELSDLEARQHWLTLERIFIENRVYKRIEEAKTSQAVRDEVWEGMHEYEDQFVRAMVEEDVKRLLEIRIRRISAYDIERSRKEVEEILQKISGVKAKLRNMTKTTIGWLGELMGEIEGQYERRTDIDTFREVDKKAVARQNIRVTYDGASGFFGSQVKSGDQSFSMSEYDRVLIVSRDGTYRILGPEDKVLIPSKAIHLALFDEEKGQIFTVVYRTKDKMAFAKKVRIQRYIRGREYRLIKDKGGKVDFLLSERTRREGLFEQSDLGEVHMTFVPKPRQRVHEATFDLDELEIIGTGARGARMAPKPVAKIKRIRP